MSKRKKKQPIPVWVGWGLFILIAACLLGWYTTNHPASSNAEAQISLNPRIKVQADLSSLSEFIVPGASNDLYKWKVTADSPGSVAIKRMTVAINIVDNYATGAQLSNFRLIKDGVDITANQVSISGGNFVNNNLPSGFRYERESGRYPLYGRPYGTSAAMYSSWINLQFGDNPMSGELVIGSGKTATFVLRAEASAGWRTKDSDSVTVQLLGDTTKPEPGATYLEDNDPTAGEWVVILANSLGFDDASDVEFIWSPMNYTPHRADLPSDTNDVRPISSGDWLNGLSVGGLPLPPFTLKV